jgi:hypothetical protein
VTSGPELRIGDAEREAAVTALGEHYAAGRLTKDEYDERADLAWQARTSSALWPLFADLPGPHTAPAASTAPTTTPTWAPTWAATPALTSRGRQHRPPAVSAGRWFRVAMAPLLLLVLALVVLTHLPLFVLLILVWVFLAKGGRHCSRGRSSMGGTSTRR